MGVNLRILIGCPPGCPNITRERPAKHLKSGYERKIHDSKFKRMLRMLFAFACIYCGSVHIQGAGVPLPDPIFIQGEVLQNSLQTILYALYVCQTIRPVSVRACGFRVSYIPAMPNGSPNPAPGNV
jgi:hypothetical protein